MISDSGGLLKTMKLLITADPELPVPPEHYGGIERIIDLLIKGLRSRGHTVGLIANNNSTCQTDAFYPWSGNTSRKKIDTIKNTFTLSKAVKNFNPDVLHTFSRLMYMLPLMRSSLPKIMSYQRQPSIKTVSWASRLSGQSLQFTGCSQYICNLGQKAGGKWHPIHNFVDLKTYSFQASVAEDAPLVFLSRIERIKGLHTSIQIAKRSGRKLLIAGNHGNSGEEGRYWENEIKPFINKDGIKYIGTVNDKEKSELLGKASAMIVPIEWDEPFGIVFAEALACGTPIISCPRGALPEIVRDGKDGFLVNSAEEACHAIKKLKEIKREDCRNRCEELFSLDVIVTKYLNLYENMLSIHNSIDIKKVA